jgi:hypothetical protein
MEPQSGSDTGFFNGTALHFTLKNGLCGSNTDGF